MRGHAAHDPFFIHPRTANALSPLAAAPHAGSRPAFCPAIWQGGWLHFVTIRRASAPPPNRHTAEMQTMHHAAERFCSDKGLAHGNL